MADYTLVISDAEVARYRMMAEVAQSREAERWRSAGVVAGTTVADVGCGPGAVSVVLATQVGPDGRVIAVERDADSLAQAQQVVAAAGVSNVELRAGDATATGITPASVDVAMMRHVLAHNGGHEQQIVDHLASLVRPGGAVYLVDVDLTAIRLYPVPPDLADLTTAYVAFHTGRGNDASVGLRLGELLTAAGLVDVEHTGDYSIVPFRPGLRPPAWAARDAMLADGVVSEGDLFRWGKAFERMDAAPEPLTLFAPNFIAVGRRPA